MGDECLTQVAEKQSGRAISQGAGLHVKLDVIPIPHKFEHNQRAVFERVERTVRPFVIDIAESETFLEKSLKQAKTGFRKERLQMLWWIKTKQIRYQQEIGERLGRSPATISRWLSLYRIVCIVKEVWRRC